MKKTFLLFAGAVCAIAILESSTGGAPDGRTGSPGDALDCTGCHSDNTSQTIPGMITSTVPSEGYEPGKTYDVTFTISENNRNKFGFQMTSEDASNSKKGKFVATSATKISAGGDYITHLSSSTAGSNKKSWTVQWVAPAKGTGTVTIYGAGNASDGMRNTTGDIIRKSALVLKEKTSDPNTSIATLKAEQSVSLFPNPALNSIQLKNAPVGEFKILNLSGMLKADGYITESNQVIDISALEKGVYLIQFNNQKVVRLVKK